MQNCLPRAEHKFLQVVDLELRAVLTHAMHNTKEGRYDISSRLNAQYCVCCYWTYLTSFILLEIDESTIICMVFWTNKLN